MDLEFIQDESADYLRFAGIDFSKRRKIKTYIAEILQYQKIPYQLQTVDCVKDYILSQAHTLNDGDAYNGLSSSSRGK